MYRTLILGFGVLVALPAYGIDDTSGWTDCAESSALLSTQPTNTLGEPQIRPGSVACFEWENQAATVDSTLFRVMDDTSALVSFDPDKDQAGAAGGGNVTVRRCLGIKPVTPASTNCVSMLPNSCAAMDGTEGNEANQCTAVRVGPGWYYIDLTVAVADGEEAIVEIRGETP